MITKAIVEEVIDEYTARVRIPRIDAIEGAKEATATDDLSIATICALAGALYTVSKGDIVFVGFEDNDMGKPIILGHLLRKELTDTRPGLMLSTLITESQTKLNSRTYIGKITPSEIESLAGIASNIQDQLDKINDELSKLKN